LTLDGNFFQNNQLLESESISPQIIPIEKQDENPLSVPKPPRGNPRTNLRSNTNIYLTPLTNQSLTNTRAGRSMIVCKEGAMADILTKQ